MGAGETGICIRRVWRKMDERCKGLGDQKGEAPHLQSSWLMLMYISQVVSSAIPP